MKRLTRAEKKLIDRLLVDLPISARVDYLEYLRTPGYAPRSIEEIDLTVILARKGWLTKPCDMVELNTVYLSRAAWDRFTLEEWQEVEEEIMKAKRGDVYGSW